MKKVLLLSSIILLICVIESYAQNSIEKKTQALLQDVESSEGNDKVNAYLNLLDYLVYTQPLSVDSTVSVAIQIAKQLNNKKAETEMLISLGYAHAKLHEPLEALKYYQQAFQLAKEIIKILLMQQIIWEYHII